MRRSWVLALAIVLLAVGVAGCLGGTDGPTENATNATPSSGDGPTAGGNTTGDTRFSPVSYDLDSAQNATFSTNGSFGPTGAPGWAGSTAGDSSHTYEFGDELPQGVPIQLDARLSYETAPSINLVGSIQLGLYSQDATFYSYRSVFQANEHWVNATVLYEGEPLIAEATYFRPTSSEDPEANYQIHIKMRPASTEIPSGAAVEVPAEPGETIQLGQTTEGNQTEGNPSLRALVFGPNDQTVTTYETEAMPLEITLPDTTANGRFVLVPLTQQDAVELRTRGSSDTLRALPVEWTYGDPHSVQGTEPVSWTFTTDTRPLGVGVYQQDNQAFSVAGPSGEVNLTGPNGTVIEANMGCNICITGGWSTAYFSGYGNEKVVPGEYTVTYEPTGEAGYEVGHYIGHYER